MTQSQGEGQPAAAGSLRLACTPGTFSIRTDTGQNSSKTFGTVNYQSGVVCVRGMRNSQGALLTYWLSPSPTIMEEVFVGTQWSTSSCSAMFPFTSVTFQEGDAEKIIPVYGKIQRDNTYVTTGSYSDSVTVGVDF